MTIPRSTYRLQFQPGFDFDAAAGIADYLRDLGVSHVYSSPYLQAVPGSTHGYDVVDPHTVNKELGGKDALDALRSKYKEHGLGEILDIVPNHMAIHHNPWWWDTLENGVASRYAPYFDIEWNSPEERLRNRILLPVLGDHYGRVLASGDVKLQRREGSFVVTYFEHEFPVAPESVSGLLAKAAERSGSAQLGFLADSLAHIPGWNESDWAARIAHHRNKEVIRQLLASLCVEEPAVAAEIDRVTDQVSRDVDALDDILSRQHYRLSYWRTAERELVYRRFFDVNTLVGVRVEDPFVFSDTHWLILKWLKDRVLDGVRVDHPDGLRDPAEYFRRLREAAPEAWVVAEKILGRGEQLRSSWPVAGTTGYDFLNLVGGLFVDPRGEAQMNQLYREFTGDEVDFAAVARDKKGSILRDILGSDINRLTALMLQICEDHREHRDYTRHEIHEAIRETVTSFPVYRTYVQADFDRVSAADRLYIQQAIDAAKAARPELDQRLFDFLCDLLLLQIPGPVEREFVMRFQQITSAAVAKGVEDTAFYSYLRLASLNEVGGDPGHFGCTPEDFHKWCEDTQSTHPATMLASSTHDTKRSEDVRARIGMISEIPQAWGDAVRRWSAWAAEYKSGEWPDRKTEYLLYQTLVGAWPISIDRLFPYMRKAAREAKERTSWITPNAAYEDALEKFIGALLADTRFIEDFETFLDNLLQPARITSLAQTLLKLTAPGVPDTYQGTELWDLSLVDPDNRRLVDYEIRKRLLGELDHTCPEQILRRMDEGLPKLWVIRQALRVRNQHPESFGAEGSYRALWPSGPKAGHVLAFGRRQNVVTVVPRLVMGLGDWDATSIAIPAGTWKNRLTGESVEGGTVALKELLRRFPVALLTLESAGEA